MKIRNALLMTILFVSSSIFALPPEEFSGEDVEIFMGIVLNGDTFTDNDQNEWVFDEERQNSDYDKGATSLLLSSPDVEVVRGECSDDSACYLLTYDDSISKIKIGGAIPLKLPYKIVLSKRG